MHFIPKGPPQAFPSVMFQSHTGRGNAGDVFRVNPHQRLVVFFELGRERAVNRAAPDNTVACAAGVMRDVFFCKTLAWVVNNNTGSRVHMLSIVKKGTVL